MLLYDQYKHAGIEDQFFINKPNLNKKQAKLIESFNYISRERDYIDRMPRDIKESSIRSHIQFNGAGGYPDDLFIYAIRKLDEKYTLDEINRITKTNSKV
ncbi:MAG: hypothetical protein ACJAYB_000005 [Psychromonas sp.]|jgi:hypothetical protein